jgi:hypothetical protein
MKGGIKETMSYTRGDFSFLPERLNYEKNMLVDAWAAMESVEGSWDYLGRPDVPGETNGFMFSRDPFVSQISAKVDKDGKIGHSGSSYGWTMRQMEYIAKNGWDAYVTLRLDRIKKDEEEEKARIEAEARRREEAAKPPRYFNDPFFNEMRAIPHFNAQIEEAEKLAASQGGGLTYAQLRSIMG